MAYDNVPVNVAAQYLDSGPGSVQRALQQNRAPYGYAVQNEEKGTWRYQISPGLLIKFQNGDLPIWPYAGFLEQVMAGIDGIVSLRAKAAIRILSEDT